MFGDKAPIYGRYQLILSGSVTVEGKRLGPDTLRFVQGNEPEAPLVCGPEGATVIVLTYDSDASKAYGGKALDDVHTVPSTREEIVEAAYRLPFSALLERRGTA